MAQLPKDMADEVGKSRVAGGGTYIVYGDYLMMITKHFYQKVQDRCIILNIVPIESRKKVILEGDKRVEIDPNPPGQECSQTSNFDGAGKLSAASNSRAPVLALFGLKENEVPDTKVSETLQYLVNTDPTPGAGMLITCSAYAKEVRSRKGEYITGLEWGHVNKPGEGLNAPALVQARLAAFAISPEKGLEVALAQVADARSKGALGVLAPETKAAPPAPTNGAAATPPAPPAPPVPPVAAAVPPPAKNPFDGWTKHPQAPGWWYRQNPAAPGGVEQKLETEIAAGR